MHVDWTNVVRVRMNRNSDRNGNSDRGRDIIDVPILFFFMMRRFHWSMLVWLIN